MRRALLLALTPLVYAAWVGVCACPRARADERDQTAWARRLEGVEQVVREALARQELPGCVVTIGTHRGPVYTRAFGQRTRGEPMTLDTLFDLASLTKPLATASAIALLSERGAFALDDPAARYLEEFATADKRGLTIRQLLLHTAGLPGVGPLSQVEHGAAAARARIAARPLAAAPGSRFVYSDLGFIVLGEIVARAAGAPLDVFAPRELFEPLGMRDTWFGVRERDLARTAPTELRDGRPIRGVVDDPRAFRLGGVAGHAGLFSTASDVGRFAQMLLRGGELGGQRVLSERSVETMLRATSIAGVRRALGWDVDSPLAHGRGRLLSPSAVGHGGYTGTSLWIDREQDLYVVLLSNRVHAGAGGTIHPLASSIADLAVRASRREAGLRVGSEVLAEEAYARLRGRRIALLTHAAARDRRGDSTLDQLASAPNVTLRAILTPEHGLTGKHEGSVAHGSHRGVPVYSLFGRTRRPSAAMLAGADMIVIDLVDVGTRFYTYMATVLATLEVAAELRLPVLLLDRPNPIDGAHMEGPISEPSFASFVNYHPLPLRHAMTAGELALFLCRARGLDTRLYIARAEGWERARWAGELDRRWHAPSPNLRSAEQALLYPAIGLIEGTNLSVGRGTARAFRVVGAPFVEGAALARALQAEALTGVTIKPTRFRPTIGPYARRTVQGVELTIVDAQRFSAARTGLALIRALTALYRGRWDDTRLPLLVAHRGTLALLAQGAPLAAIEASWAEELAAFARAREAVLLY